MSEQWTLPDDEKFDSEDPCFAVDMNGPKRSSHILCHRARGHDGPHANQLYAWWVRSSGRSASSERTPMSTELPPPQIPGTSSTLWKGLHFLLRVALLTIANTTLLAAANTDAGLEWAVLRLTSITAMAVLYYDCCENGWTHE